MGTPDFAVASLRRLVEDGHEVVGVFTQPDKPKNRGMKLTLHKTCRSISRSKCATGKRSAYCGSLRPS